jgi:hypothetical protein
MLNPHFFKWESILLICLVAVVFGAVTASAYVRPANPTMDYVPQNIGIYDTFYTYFNEPDCRVCHGTSTAERHHHTTYALGGDCLYCHYSYPITIPAEKDCKVCHIDNGIIPYPGVPVGGEDLGFPHHRSDLADSWQCTACHNPNLLSETYTVPVPSYEVSDITPTPGACENCHWQSDQGVDSSGITVGATYPGTDMVEFMNDWDTWTGLTKPTTGPDGLPHPAPIGHSGMQTSGAKWNGTQDNFGLGPGVNRFSIFMPAKPGKDPTFGLEEQPGKIYSECYLCHSQNPDGSINTDPDDPNNIRACETCHDIYTLHDIEEHMTTNNIYTVAGVLNQTIYCEAGSAWKCLACHGNYIGLPPTAAETPAILPLSYNFGSPGVVFDILPDAVSFGLKEAGDHVEMCQPSVVDCTVAANWEEVPTYSWDEHLIRARVPGWTFAPDTNTKVRVVKAGASPKKSNQRNFTIRKHPEITTLAPSAGQYGDDVIVYGLGFYTNQHTVPSGDYGFYTYVELSSSNDTYRVIKYPNGVDPWSPGDFGMRLKPLLDVRTGSPIPPSLATLLYVGNWNVTVVTDYFLDDGDGTYFDSATGKLDLRVEDVEPWNLADGPMGTGTGDELVWRERSVPAVFNVNSNPAIWNINSTKIPAGDNMKVTGINFGASQGTGKVRVGKCLEVIGDLIPGTTLPIGDEDGKCEGWTEIIGDGRGNDNGKCEDNEPCQKEVCYVKTTGSKLANVKTWSTTKIVAKVPSFGSTGYPKAKCVQVELSNGKISNAFKIKILAP